MIFPFQSINFYEFTPEVNAAYLYDPAGASSLFATSEAWTQTSGRLSTAAGNIHGVLETLPGLWWGFGASRMIKAASSYLLWLQRIIDCVDMTAARFKSIAQAYEKARDAMVPAQTCNDLLADINAMKRHNDLAQYTPQIEAIQAIYHRHWENNAQLMHGYANEVAAVLSAVPMFPEPAPIVQKALCVVQ